MPVILTGDTVYLVPRTLGCARECWQQPQCTVVRIAPPNITVRLPDGREITTHEHNAVHRLPGGQRSPKKSPESGPGSAAKSAGRKPAKSAPEKVPGKVAEFEDVPMFDIPAAISTGPAPVRDDGRTPTGPAGPTTARREGRP